MTNSWARSGRDAEVRVAAVGGGGEAAVWSAVGEKSATRPPDPVAGSPVVEEKAVGGRLEAVVRSAVGESREAEVAADTVGRRRRWSRTPAVKDEGGDGWWGGGGNRELGEEAADGALSKALKV
uniref:DUF834 domain-containing protein n=1 Tax=Oryza nivara TaxID=4536 RepID=A0A0E0JB56_ORYNI